MTVPAEPKSTYSNNHGATQDIMDDLNGLSDKNANATDVSKEFQATERVMKLKRNGDTASYSTSRKTRTKSRR
ncbi:hypothetical protein MSBR3_1151 [Methanosarcina barkeri 3]|uniref:Uncharacterized protein n=1 Tax=Methanosarcina barkeri 3 TaxID=1434107 RepID=A0A0E3WWK2_METBA|nr:hypothetical protein [Methanosarcina barkeri]AKB81729.1 hypothetical protein MSBR3_1151 [Methanosarcina barkeri 3]